MARAALPGISSPPVCRRAWVRYLKGEGATIQEIAAALQLPEKIVESILRQARGTASSRVVP